MAYVKNTWVDQAGQVRYTETEDDGYKIFTANYDEVTELGTPVNAANMNHIEDGIFDLDAQKASVDLDNLSILGQAIINNKADVDLTNVDDSGTSKGASWAMPSDTYEDLTLGASEATYSAPANGWVLFTGQGAGHIGLSQGRVAIYNCSYGGSNYYSVLLPVLKGNYTAFYGGATKITFRFIYAKGSESEA